MHTSSAVMTTTITTTNITTTWKIRLSQAPKVFRAYQILQTEFEEISNWNDIFLTEADIHVDRDIPALPPAYADLYHSACALYVTGFGNGKAIREVCDVFEVYGKVLKCPTVISLVSMQVFRWVIMATCGDAAEAALHLHQTWSGFEDWRLCISAALSPGRMLTLVHKVAVTNTLAAVDATRDEHGACHVSSSAESDYSQSTLCAEEADGTIRYDGSDDERTEVDFDEMSTCLNSHPVDKLKKASWAEIVAGVPHAVITPARKPIVDDKRNEILHEGTGPQRLRAASAVGVLRDQALTRSSRAQSSSSITRVCEQVLTRSSRAVTTSAIRAEARGDFPEKLIQRWRAEPSLARSNLTPPPTIETVYEQIRVVFILDIPESMTLQQVSDAIKEGPLVEIKFGKDANDGKRFAGVIFQWALDAENFYQALVRERAEGQPTRFQKYFEFVRGNPFPKDQFIRAMAGPLYATRRLTIVKGKVFFHFKERQLHDLCSRIVSKTNIQLVWLYNGGNATVVFSSVESAMKVKKELDRRAASAGSLGGFPPCWEGLRTSFSKDPCAVALKLHTHYDS